MDIYFLHRGYNIEKFREICKAIEREYPYFEKQVLLTDVDDSLVQVYSYKDSKIIITNSAELDLIKAVSNIDLSEFEYTEAIIKDDKLLLLKHNKANE